MQQGTYFARLQNSSHFAIFFHSTFTEIRCPIYPQVLLKSQWNSSLETRSNVVYFFSWSRWRNVDRFALFLFCQQLKKKKKYIFWLLWHLVLHHFKRVLKGLLLQSVVPAIAKQNIVLPPFFIVNSAKGTKFSKLSAKKPFQRDSLALKRNQQRPLHDTHMILQPGPTTPRFSMQEVGYPC